MGVNQQYDAGHFAFLELIRVLNDLAGPRTTKISMYQLGLQAAAAVPELAFETMEEFEQSIEEMANPISQFEGEARHYGNGIFGLPACPFTGAITNYKKIKSGMPEEYKEITASLNQSSPLAEKLRVGQGAAVSPFCGVHQPIRSALGQRITIGGKRLKIYQLGCKSAAGAKGLADPLIERAKADRQIVDQILDDNMCCYCVRLEDEEGTEP